MNKKKLALIMIVASMLLAVPLAMAQIPPRVTTWTDRPKYSPGDTVTLNIAYYNAAPSPVEIKNITLTFLNWKAYIGGSWVGNMTKTYTGTTVTSGAVHVFNDLTFSVPTDGRAEGTSVSIAMGIDNNIIDPIASTSVYLYTSDRYADQTVMLLTILVVLMIVCTIIIAATIFLSARRPQVMWKTEEKT